ncbi:MAG: ABC transporter ATP-binding protein [Candidatus Humimicrobiaceae bacterium]
MIETINLTKKYGSLIAVDNISFKVKKSEIFSFLGPNGAGKTTTIRMLATLLQPTSGEIIIDGKSPGNGSTYIRSVIGILTENPGMYEKITAYDNLMYFSSFYGLADKKRRTNIEKLLKMFGLWERRHELVSTYSKGMKQKLSLARALIHEPKILFLDEPTSGLDPESARMVRDFIISLKKEETTVFLCTHNLAEASSLSDRVCIINREIIKVASLEELQNYKKNRMAELILKDDAKKYAGFLKDIKNILDVSIRDNKVLLSLSDPENTNPKIIKKLVERGAEIQYFNEIKASLEDIYLDLMRTEKKQ